MGFDDRFQDEIVSEHGPLVLVESGENLRIVNKVAGESLEKPFDMMKQVADRLLQTEDVEVEGNFFRFTPTGFGDQYMLVADNGDIVVGPDPETWDEVFEAIEDY